MAVSRLASVLLFACHKSHLIKWKFGALFQCTLCTYGRVCFLPKITTAFATLSSRRKEPSHWKVLSSTFNFMLHCFTKIFTKKHFLLTVSGCQKLLSQVNSILWHLSHKFPVQSNKIIRCALWWWSHFGHANVEWATILPHACCQSVLSELIYMQWGKITL